MLWAGFCGKQLPQGFDSHNLFTRKVCYPNHLSNGISLRKHILGSSFQANANALFFAYANATSLALLLCISQGIRMVAETLHFAFVIHKFLYVKIRNFHLLSEPGFSGLKDSPDYATRNACLLLSDLYPENPGSDNKKFTLSNKGEHTMKKTIATIAIAIALCFAQDAPEKLAVYTHGSDAGVNKSFSGKLLKAMSQGGRYAETADPEALQDELARGGSVGLAQAAQAAKRHGADYVCVVSMTEAFGTYSVTARLVRTADAQVAKTGYAERPLKSMDDLAAVSGELARQLLPPGSYVPPLPASAAAPPPVEAAAAAQKQCAKPYNINELLFKVKDGFPGKLKDCSSTLAKDMLNPFGKKLEPKSLSVNYYILFHVAHQSRSQCRKSLQMQILAHFR
jgi:hypothetical protein